MFQAWLVKMAKIAAHSAPNSLPGNRRRKNTTVKVRKPSTGTDCRISSAGTITSSAVRLLAASVATTKVNSSETMMAANMRKRRAQGVFRQVGGVERHGLAGQPRGGRRHFVRAMGDQHEDARDQDEDREIVEIGEEALAAQPERLGDGAVLADHRHPRFLCVSSVAPTGKRERARAPKAGVPSGSRSPGREARPWSQSR